MNTLPFPDPSFIDRDPTKVLSDQIKQWETLTGKPLYPAQVEHLLINLVAYREILLRVGIQEAAKQNLVEFARYPVLDFLGELVGTYRLMPTKASCVLQFKIPEVRLSRVGIPTGTQVYAGNIVFETIADCAIEPGQTTVSVEAAAKEAGTFYNNLIPGSLVNLIPPVDSLVMVKNLTVSQGGLDMEDDDRFRKRIKLASNRFATAGPLKAYEYFVLSVRQDIVAVRIHQPRPGKVRVYPLLETGLPEQTLLVKIFDTLSDTRVMPLTDELEVVPPTEVQYAVTMNLKLHYGVEQEATLKAVENRLKVFAAELQKKLGQELVASQWEGEAHKVPGVYRAWCNLTEDPPNSGPGVWNRNTGIEVLFAGFDQP